MHGADQTADAGDTVAGYPGAYFLDANMCAAYRMGRAWGFG